MQTYTITTSNSKGNSRKKYHVIADTTDLAIAKLSQVCISKGVHIYSVKLNKKSKQL